MTILRNIPWLTADNPHLSNFKIEYWADKLIYLEALRRQEKYTHIEVQRLLTDYCDGNRQMAYRSIRHYNELYRQVHHIPAFRPSGKPTELPTLRQIRSATQELNEMRKQIELKLGITPHKMLA